MKTMKVGIYFIYLKKCKIQGIIFCQDGCEIIIFVHIMKVDFFFQLQFQVSHSLIIFHFGNTWRWIFNSWLENNLFHSDFQYLIHEFNLP